MAWFDTNWNYRQKVKITNDTGSAYSNEVIRLVIRWKHLFDNTRSDGYDVRITNLAGDTLYDFERTTWDTSQNIKHAEFKIKVPSIPTGESYFYVYYGNASAGDTSTSITGTINEDLIIEHYLGWEAQGSENNYHLPYWIEHDETGAILDNNLWTKLDLSSTKNKDITIYYNGNTDKSDGDAVFLFFDDFKETSLDEYIWENASDYPASVQIDEENDKLKIRGAYVDYVWSRAYIRSKYQFKQTDKEFFGYGRLLVATDPGAHLFFIIDWDGNTDSSYDRISNGYYVVRQDNSYGLKLRYGYNNNIYDLQVDTSEIADTNYHRYRISQVSNQIDAYEDNIHLSGTNSYFSNGYLGLSSRDDSSHDTEYEWVALRKYSNANINITYGTETDGSWTIDGETYTKKRVVTISSDTDLSNYQVQLDYSYFNSKNMIIEEETGGTKTKTSNGNTRIEKTIQKTKQGKSKTVIQGEKTYDGIARLLVISQLNKTGNASIKITGFSLTKNGNARLKKMTQKTKQGTADIKKNKLQIDKNGNAKIEIKKSITKEGIANIKTGKTITKQGDARIEKTIQKTKQGTARVMYRSTIAKNGNAKIKIHIQTNKDGTADIKKNKLQINKQGKSKIVIQGEKTYDGIARILIEQQITKTGNANIKTNQIQITKNGIARILIEQQITKTGNAILNFIKQITKTGSANIKIQTQINKQGKSRVKKANQITKNGVARILSKQQINKNGTGKIVYLESFSKQGKGYVFISGKIIKNGTAKVRKGGSITKDGTAKIVWQAEYPNEARFMVIE